MHGVVWLDTLYLTLTTRYEVLDVAVLGDNSQFVSCGEDKAAFLWDVSTGAVVRRMQGHEQRINACCFSTEGSVLFTASYDKVRLACVALSAGKPLF